MNVQLLYFAGCPNVDLARRRLRQALDKADRPTEWEEIDLASDLALGAGVVALVGASLWNAWPVQTKTHAPVATGTSAACPRCVSSSAATTEDRR